MCGCEWLGLNNDDAIGYDVVRLITKNCDWVRASMSDCEELL